MLRLMVIWLTAAMFPMFSLKNQVFSCFWNVTMWLETKLASLRRQIKTFQWERRDNAQNSCPCYLMWQRGNFRERSFELRKEIPRLNEKRMPKNVFDRQGSYWIMLQLERMIKSKFLRNLIHLCCLVFLREKHEQPKYINANFIKPFVSLESFCFSSAFCSSSFGNEFFQDFLC